MNEIWKDIDGFEGLYQVSSWGRVKSLNYNHTGKEKILNTYAGTTGYYNVGLFKNGKKYSKRINRLIAETFIDNPNNLPCVNHINGIKTDNRVENLEWISYKENNIHAVETGLRKEFTGKKKPVHCPELNLDFESISDAARYFNCNHNSIHYTLKGKIKKLHKKYTFAYV